MLSRSQKGLRLRFLESHRLIGVDDVLVVYVVASQSGRQCGHWEGLVVSRNLANFAALQGSHMVVELANLGIAVL